MENSNSQELVMFYNVENLFSPDKKPVHKLDPTISGLTNWDERKYQHKLSKIAQVFDLVRKEEGVLPMLIGLSEIHGQTPLENLVALEPLDSNYGIVHYESLDERGVDVALLFDKSKIEIVHAEPITFFFETDPQSPVNYDTTRDVLFCKVRYLKNKDLINVFVCHLPSKREKDVNRDKRVHILSEIRERIIKLNLAGEATILCGDFNENPDADYLNNLLYNDEFNKILHNPFLDLYNRGFFSAFHLKSGLVFDQIYLSTEFFTADYQLQFQEAKVFSPEKLRSGNKDYSNRPFRTYAGTRYLGGYSDHFPVIIKLLQHLNN